MANKKVYRSLFDSDEVYEVTELTDDPEVSSDGVASVKKDSDPEPTKGHTIEDCWGAIQKIADAVGCKLDGEDKGKKGVTDANSPAEGNEVTKQNPTLDSEDDEDGEEDDKSKKVSDSEDEDDPKAPQEVKDAYKGFTSVGEKKKFDIKAATQVAFQNRYNAVANK